MLALDLFSDIGPADQTCVLGDIADTRFPVIIVRGLKIEVRCLETRGVVAAFQGGRLIVRAAGVELNSVLIYFNCRVATHYGVVSFDASAAGAGKEIT